MTSPTTRPVLVGVDGLPGSAGALRYAVAEARRRQTSLRLVHVVPSFLSVGPPIPLSDLEQVGTEILEQEEKAVRRMAPDLTVSTVLTHGERSTGVVKAAEAAQLVVIGRETRRGIDRMLTGTTTAAVAAHAPCDVVVVPSFWVDAHQRNRVVVGLKSRHNCSELLSQAFSEAAARNASLVVVMAWQVSDPYSDRIESRTHADEWETNGRELIAEVTTDWHTAYPEVGVEPRVVHGAPARVLLEHSSESDLLVISRRRFPLPPYGHLGGVGHSLLRLSDVPVHVVPYAADPPGQDQELVLESAGVPLK